MGELLLILACSPIADVVKSWTSRWTSKQHVRNGRLKYKFKDHHEHFLVSLRWVAVASALMPPDRSNYPKETSDGSPPPSSAFMRSGTTLF